MTIVPPGFVDIALLIERTGDPDPFITTFGVRVLSPPFTQANLAALAASTVARLDDHLNSTERFIGMRARVGQDGGAPLLLEQELDAPGVGSSTRLPANCAVLISKLTNVGGRTGRGRMFWPSIAETSVDELGLITVGTRDTFQVSFDGLLSDIQTSTSATENTDAMVVLHQTVPNPPAVVTGLRVERLIATQRRRLRR